MTIKYPGYLFHYLQKDTLYYDENLARLGNKCGWAVMVMVGTGLTKLLLTVILFSKGRNRS